MNPTAFKRKGTCLPGSALVNLSCFSSSSDTKEGIRKKRDRKVSPQKIKHFFSLRPDSSHLLWGGGGLWISSEEFYNLKKGGVTDTARLETRGSRNSQKLLAFRITGIRRFHPTKPFLVWDWTRQKLWISHEITYRGILKALESLLI